MYKLHIVYVLERNSDPDFRSRKIIDFFILRITDIKEKDKLHINFKIKLLNILKRIHRLYYN